MRFSVLAALLSVSSRYVRLTGTAVPRNDLIIHRAVLAAWHNCKCHGQAGESLAGVTQKICGWRVLQKDTPGCHWPLSQYHHDTETVSVVCQEKTFY